MTQLYVKNGNVYIDQTFRRVNLFIKNGKFVKFLPEDKEIENGIIYDAKGQYVVPGFIDLHTHGGINIDVNGTTFEELEKLCHFFASNGTTAWLSSILTDTAQQTLSSIEKIHTYKQHFGKNTSLLGIHLEGPFLSREFKGAMPEHLLKPFDLKLLEKYQERAEGGIKYITVAPEVKGVAENIQRMKEFGLVISLGHSGADYETTIQCFDRGAASITHIFNAMKPLHHREPGILVAALEREDIYCEAIFDGFHLHPAVVRLLLKVKGLDKVVAVTDSMMATGLSDGNYKLGVNDVVVKNGVARIAGKNVLAGSTLTSKQSLKNIMRFTNKQLEEILPLYTKNPAKMLGIFSEKGSISISKDADFVILDNNLDVVSTFINGKQVYEKSY